MIIIKFGRWSHASLLFFSYERIYIRYRWTPFCKIRYKKRLEPWSVQERLRFLFECWLADFEQRIKKINRRFEK